MPFFKRKANLEGLQAPVAQESKRKSFPAGLWTKCPDCGYVIFRKVLLENFSVCPKCTYHFVMGAKERIACFLDERSFKEMDPGLETRDVLRFQGPKSYVEKLKQDRKLTGLKEACIAGSGTLKSQRIAFGVTDSRFIMGSMGSVVGEKVTRLIEFALAKKHPLVIVSGSGGGARMYEGMFSLMQMAKTSSALARLSEEGIPFVSILTNPTMGGVMASFAALGDVIVAEPKALLGFAGPRVIEQTIRQKLPENFQTSEFLLEHGLIDLVVDRQNLRNVVNNILSYLS